MKETIASAFIRLRNSLQSQEMQQCQDRRNCQWQNVLTDENLLAVVRLESVSIEESCEYIEFIFRDESMLTVDTRADGMWSTSQLDDDIVRDVTLYDAMSDLPRSEESGVGCRITTDQYGIYIRPEGYGDCDSADGKGCPVMVEFFNGEMRVVAWPDINHDRYEAISLEGAREDAREPDDNQDTPNHQVPIG